MRRDSRANVTAYGIRFCLEFIFQGLNSLPAGFKIGPTDGL